MRHCRQLLLYGFSRMKSENDLKELSETLCKETIDLYNTSENRFIQKSFVQNFPKTGKDLISQGEITVMDGNKLIWQLRGVRLFLSEKYDIKNIRRMLLISSTI